MSEQKPQTSVSSSRKTMLLLMAVFIGPLLLAWFLFANHDNLPIPGAKTHGQLVHPARPFDDFTLQGLDDTPYTLADLQGSWTLLYLGSSECDLYCQASLFKMRQVRLRLGREMSRVQRLYLLTDNRDLDTLQELLGEHRGMRAAVLDGDGATIVNKTFGELPKGHIYMVDPLGNLMMQYPPDATSRGILKDIKRVLKVSKIG